MEIKLILMTFYHCHVILAQCKSNVLAFFLNNLNSAYTQVLHPAFVQYLHALKPVQYSSATVTVTVTILCLKLFLHSFQLVNLKSCRLESLQRSRRMQKKLINARKSWTGAQFGSQWLLFIFGTLPKKRKTECTRKGQKLYDL